MTSLAIGIPAAAIAGLSISEGFQQKAKYEENARVYEQQAKSISEAAKLSEKQNIARKRQLYGSGLTQAAASGLKLSGSLAQSLNQSLTQLGIDESMNQYGYKVQKAATLTRAKEQRYKGNTALMQGYTKGAASIMTLGYM
jgi:hypothetical protein